MFSIKLYNNSQSDYYDIYQSFKSQITFHVIWT